MTEAEWLSCENPGRMLDWLDRPAHERKLRLFACACARLLLPPLHPGEEAGPMSPEEIDGRMGPGDLGRVVAKAGRWAVEVSEAFADGAGTEEELAEAFNVLPVGTYFTDYPGDGEFASEEEILEAAAAQLAYSTAAQTARWAAGSACQVLEELAAQRASFRLEAPEAGERAYHDALTAGASSHEAWLASEEAQFGPARAAGKDARAAADAELCRLLREFFGDPFRPAPAIDPEWLAWDHGLAARLARAIYDEHRFDELPVLADALEEAGCADAALLSHLRGPGPHARGCWALDLILGKS
jgi:hypothetical protein